MLFLLIYFIDKISILLYLCLIRLRYCVMCVYSLIVYLFDNSLMCFLISNLTLINFDGIIHYRRKHIWPKHIWILQSHVHYRKITIINYCKFCGITIKIYAIILKNYLAKWIIFIEIIGLMWIFYIILHIWENILQLRLLWFFYGWIHGVNSKYIIWFKF